MPQINTYWTSVLKKIIYLIVLIIGLLISLKLVVFYMPFLVAFIISLIIEPAIRWMMKHMKISRKFSSIIVFIIVFGIILGLLIWGIATIVSEAMDLMSGFNEYYEKIYSGIQGLIGGIRLDGIIISQEISQITQEAVYSLLQKASVIFQGFLTGILKMFTSIPTIGIYFGVTVLSLYFICTDKIYMLDEVEHHLPEKWAKGLIIHLKQIIRTLGGYLKAQVILIGISFVISLIGLYIMQFAGLDIGFPLLTALGIGFIDALPILGSGSVMVPWAIISALNGNLILGISVIVLWIIMSITRQFIEPKIVSGNIGIHPIFTIISMYTGFRLIGVIGMFVGPILLIILKNIFSDFIDGGIMKVIFEED